MHTFFVFFKYFIDSVTCDYSLSYAKIHNVFFIIFFSLPSGVQTASANANFLPRFRMNFELATSVRQNRLLCPSVVPTNRPTDGVAGIECDPLYFDRDSPTRC